MAVVRMVGIKEELEHTAGFPLSLIGTRGDWLQTLMCLLSQVTILIVLVLYLAAVSEDSSSMLSDLCSVWSKEKT